MTIINKNTQSSGAGQSDAYNLGGWERSTKGRQHGAETFHPFDFSEQALLSNDPFAQEGSQEKDQKSTDHENTIQSDAGERRHSKSEDDPTLLAIVGAQSISTPIGKAEAADFKVSLSVQGSHRIDDIIARIEQTIRASLHGIESGPLTFSLRLDDLHIEGLRSIHIVMDANAVDVRLARDSGAVTPALIAAAQELAQQLSVRFPKRVIRVLDGEFEGEVLQENDLQPKGLAAISQLLDRGSRRP